MNRRLQIVISSKRPVGAPGASSRPGFLPRFKLLIAGCIFAVVAIAVLVVALILGWILAALVWIALVAVIVVAIFKTTLKRSE
jgi:hypothetical protein